MTGQPEYRPRIVERNRCGRGGRACCSAVYCGGAVADGLGSGEERAVLLTQGKPSDAAASGAVRSLAARPFEVEFISVPEWGRRVGLSRNTAYRAARLGSIAGCIHIGQRYIVNWPAFVASSARADDGWEGIRSLG